MLLCEVRGFLPFMKTKKIGRFGEAAWVVGMVVLSLGVSLMSKAGFGMSMIVSPAYILHLALVKTWPWFTFGCAEYVVQAILIVIMCFTVRRFRWQYLLSFATGVLYGLILDGWLLVFGTEVFEEMPMRIASFAIGLACSGFSIALFFRTYLPIQAYDMFITEVSSTYKLKQGAVKWVYDFVCWQLPSSSR